MLMPCVWFGVQRNALLGRPEARCFHMNRVTARREAETVVAGSAGGGRRLHTGVQIPQGHRGGGYGSPAGVADHTLDIPAEYRLGVSADARN